MRTKKLVGGVLAAGLLGVGGVAEAEVYVGANIGSAGYNYKNVRNSMATKLYAGFVVPKIHLGVEAAYVDLGEADITDYYDEQTLHMKGSYVAGVFSYTDPDGGMGFFARVGGYSLETTVDVGFADDTEDDSGVVWGLGVSNTWSSGFGVRAEVEGYQDVEVESIGHDKTVTVYSVGVQYSF